jgi:hypothetical protein
MTRYVAVLLALSVSLYSTPLKADSYSNEDQDVFVEDPTTIPEDCSCQINPESVEESSPASPQEQQEVYTDNGNYTDVSPENTEQTKRVRTKYWQNILLAVAVVAVAITAMLLVHSHQGHKSHH